MARLTRKQLNEILRRSAIKLPDNVCNTGEVAKLERDSGDGSLAASKTSKGSKRRFSVRIVSYRKRLCDADNLCAKRLCDLVRRVGAFPDDSPEYIDLSVSQKKIGKEEEEWTEIIVEII